MQGIEKGLIAELVESAYVAAVSPEKAAAFLSLWSGFILDDVADAPELRDLEYHLRQCHAILRRSKNSPALSDAAIKFVSEHIGPACLIDEYGTMILGNDASTYALGLQTGANLRASQLVDETASSILAWMKQAKEKNAARLFIDEEEHDSQRASVLVRRVHVETQHLDLNTRVGSSAFLVTAVDMQVGDAAIHSLADAFGLSSAEAAVAKSLCNGRQAADIAEDRGASINTVRSQIKSILKKMPAKGISDLVRIVWSFSATLQRHPDKSESAHASNDNSAFLTNLGETAPMYDVLVFTDLCDDTDCVRQFTQNTAPGLSVWVSPNNPSGAFQPSALKSSGFTKVIVSGSGTDAAIPCLVEAPGLKLSVFLARPVSSVESDVRRRLYDMLKRGGKLVEGSARFIVKLLSEHVPAFNSMTNEVLSIVELERLARGMRAILAADLANLDQLVPPNLESTALSAISDGEIVEVSSLEDALLSMEAVLPASASAPKANRYITP